METMKLIRLLRGLSQWDLSQRTGLPNYRISLIENGRIKPSKKELRILTKELETDVSVLTAGVLLLTFCDNKIEIVDFEQVNDSDEGSRLPVGQGERRKKEFEQESKEEDW